MEKKSILFLILIVIAGVLFRVWGITPINAGVIELDFHKCSFFEIMFENVYAPVYPILSKVFSLGFLDRIYPYLSIIFDVFSIIVLYFAGREFNDKKNEELTGLISAGFGGISVLLVHLAQNNSVYSLVFLLSSLIILYSIKVINTQDKKYLIPIFILDIVLVLTFNLGVFFCLFDILGIMSFYSKKRKSFESYFVTFIGLLLLVSPILPFILSIINVPDYIAKYSLPFDFRHVFVYFANIFSPKLNLTEDLDLTNVGFWIFVILTSAIGLFLSIKGVLHKRNASYFSIALFISTFLSMLVVCICAHEILLSEYLVTIYPLCIISLANGVPSLKLKTLKVALPTIYATIIVFYLIANNIISANLF